MAPYSIVNKGPSLLIWNNRNDIFLANNSTSVVNIFVSARYLALSMSDIHETSPVQLISMRARHLLNNRYARPRTRSLLLKKIAVQTFSFPHDNSSSLYPIFMKLHLCIDSNEGKSHIEYGLCPSNIKVTVGQRASLKFDKLFIDNKIYKYDEVSQKAKCVGETSYRPPRAQTQTFSQMPTQEPPTASDNDTDTEPGGGASSDILL